MSYCRFKGQDKTFRQCCDCWDTNRHKLRNLFGGRSLCITRNRHCESCTKLNERIKELENVMVIIQTEASDGLATMKNEERPDIQHLLRRVFNLVTGCQIVS